MLNFLLTFNHNKPKTRQRQRNKKFRGQTRRDPPFRCNRVIGWRHNGDIMIPNAGVMTGQKMLLFLKKLWKTSTTGSKPTNSNL